MKYNSFKEMPVWKESLELSEKIFHLSSKLPRSEDYGLISQIRRSANSISANIAEGFGRKGIKDKAHFYVIARGSAFETQSHLLYGESINYFNKDSVKDIISLYDNLIYSINKLIKAINA